MIGEAYRRNLVRCKFFAHVRDEPLCNYGSHCNNIVLIPSFQKSIHVGDESVAMHQSIQLELWSVMSILINLHENRKIFELVTPPETKDHMWQAGNSNSS